MTNVPKCKKVLSEVGFEPTPTFVDQNAHSYVVKSLSLESGALDRSAILTFLTIHKTFMFIKQRKQFEVFMPIIRQFDTAKTNVPLYFWQ